MKMFNLGSVQTLSKLHMKMLREMLIKLSNRYSGYNKCQHSTLQYIIMLIQKPSSANDEDAQLSKAIEMSINEAKDKKITLEPLNPEQRIRKPGIPVGLKNIGNSTISHNHSLLLQFFIANIFPKVIIRSFSP